MLSYDPFLKNFDEVDAADLALLRDVAEGWYVEYKRQLPPTRKALTAGKSLCAFANHYGGWLFYAIESDKDSRVAKGFPGLPMSEIPMRKRYATPLVTTHILRRSSALGWPKVLIPKSVCHLTKLSY